MTRVVLDTNVIVSAHIQSAGIPARILLQALAQEFQLYVSSSIIAEYDDVLRRPKFEIDSQVVDGFLKALSTTAVLIVPTAVIPTATDPDDNKFLECAFEAEADYLVTGNLKDYPTEGFSGSDPAGRIVRAHTRIVSPREFMGIIES